MNDKMRPPEGGAVVRMYCAGLGDCFLLAFRAKDRKAPSYVLIDCGVWKGTPGATAWMRQIMQHIVDEVGDQGLDLLVATHQHWDHLSGFCQAKESFEKLRVKEVWLPWTEDPGDPTAVRMAEERRMAMRAALAAVGHLRAGFMPEEKPNDPPDVRRRVRALRAAVEDAEAVLEFAGYTPPDDEDALQVNVDLEAVGFGASDLLGAGPSTEDLLDAVCRKVAKPCYIQPSLEPRAIKGLQDVRIYALGPPTDPKYLGKDDPSPGSRSEVYMSEDAALYAAALRDGQASEEDPERRELACPFDRWQRCPRKDVATHPDFDFFRTRYLEKSDRAPAWRRIDTDWLETVGQLALNFDNHINNTSLVLAFELGAGGPVLLFPGDAQVGSWLSWHELKSYSGVTAESLLSRTVLYKVGHHASHNATLRDKGLKMMNNTSRLVAMIPVDEKEAHKPKGRKTKEGKKKGWDMPYDKLLADLVERTEGRVLRADRDPEEPTGGSEDMNKRWIQFRESTVVRKVDFQVQGKSQTRTLFIQYTVRK